MNSTVAPSASPIARPRYAPSARSSKSISTGGNDSPIPDLHVVVTAKRQHFGLAAQRPGAEQPGHKKQLAARHPGLQHPVTEALGLFTRAAERHQIVQAYGAAPCPHRSLDELFFAARRAPPK